MSTLPFSLRRSSGLFKKAILIYIVLAILPTILVTAAAVLIYTNERTEESRQMMKRYASQTETIIAERMELFENVFYRLIADLNFIHSAEVLNSEEDLRYSSDYLNASDTIRNYIYTYSDIRGAAYLPDLGNPVSVSRWYNSSGDLSWSAEDMRQEILRNVTDTERLTFMAMRNLSRYDHDNPDYVLFMAMPVRNLVTKKRSGVLVFAISQNVFLFRDLHSADFGIETIVTDKDGSILAGTDNAYVNRSLEDYLAEYYAGRHIETQEDPIGETQWQIVNLVDTAELVRVTYRFITLVILLMLMITTTFFLIVFRYLRGYLGEVFRIASGIEQYNAESPEPIRIELAPDDELGLIVSRFNEMGERVNELVQTLKDRNEEIRIVETDRRHAEIKALEAQINPHFLYNTLDTINWMAIDHGEEEISDMLGSLGSLLRYSISNIDILVLLRAEIKWIRNYVKLQMERFGNSFSCRYEISDDALDFPIYKMLLQPLIENSILHAFEDMDEGGLITVSASVLPDNRLEIRIADNGKGMDEEVLARMQRETSGREGLDSRSIGISNVAMRLRIYYQDEADFEITSQEHVGTTVVLRVPARHEIYR